MFTTPILLITFNRPDHVRQVLIEIRKQQPAQLFVCQDGAREGNVLDFERMQQVRDVINELVDWPCELHTLYQDKNLGCGPGPATGISWFFSQVEMGIVLEDDAVPHPDFFEYAVTLLEKYKDDESVRAIGSMKLYDETFGEMDKSSISDKKTTSPAPTATTKEIAQNNFFAFTYVFLLNLYPSSG